MNNPTESLAALAVRAVASSEPLDAFLAAAAVSVREALSVDACGIFERMPDAVVVPRAIAADDRVARETLAAPPAGWWPAVRGAPGPVALGDDGGLRASLACALDDAGLVVASSRTPRSFTPTEHAFLQAVTALVAGAISRDATRVVLEIETAARAVQDVRSLHDAAATVHAMAVRALGAVYTDVWTLVEGHTERVATFGAAPRVPPAMSLAEGVGQRACASRQVEWLTRRTTPEQFPEGASASSGVAAGVASGVVVPVVAADRALALVRTYFGAAIPATPLVRDAFESLGHVAGNLMLRLGAEDRLRVMIEQAPLGIAERSLDGRWQQVNDRLCAITGYARDELLGMPFSAIVHPADMRREAELQEALREGRLTHYAIEKRYVRKDGATVWVSISCSVVRKSSDEPGYCVVMVEDISARRRAVDELRASEARFRRALLASPVPVMLYDDAGDVLALSRSWASVTGYRFDAIPTVDEWLRHAYTDTEAQAVAREGFETWHGEPRHGLEHRIRTGTGEVRILSFSHSEVLGRTADGRRQRVLVAGDVTRQREFEDELLRANRQKDEFIGMLSHELRNPIAAIQGATELLDPTSAATEPIRARAHGVLARQTGHMAALLDGLLDISRIVRGRIELGREVVDLTQLVSDAAGDFADRAAAAGLSLETELPDGALPVLGDPLRLTQVVSNLLTNAVAYTPAPGSITVRLSRDGDAASLAVRDTGQGIAPDMLSTVFEMFQRGTRERERASGGLGVGLALVQLLTHLHGGSVVARSEGLGRGAEFLVRLPLTSDAARPASQAPALLEPQRVLLIEDHADVAEALSCMLRLQGHTVSIASDGARGLRLAHEMRPDVILCDIGLPGGQDGLDVARQLRADSATASVPLVALTGYGTALDRWRTRDAGFDAHLTKPVSFDRLQAVLVDLVGARA